MSNIKQNQKAVEISSELDQAESTIEAFSVSRSQARAIEVFAQEGKSNRVVFTWREGVELEKVRGIIQDRLASQPMFDTVVLLREPVFESLQSVGSGQATWVTTSRGTEFDAAMQRPFLVGGEEVLRIVFQIGNAEEGVVRLGLSTPPYISDVDGLLLLASGQDREGLTFQHFSEWSLEQEDFAVDTPISLTALDIRSVPRVGGAA